MGIYVDKNIKKAFKMHLDMVYTKNYSKWWNNNSFVNLETVNWNGDFMAV